MRSLLTALVVASAVAASSPAFADPLSAQDEAQQRFQTGLKFYDARDFESARLAFTQAYAVLQKPSILLNLALSELYSNHSLEAIPHLEQFLKDPAAPAERKDRAKKALDEAMKKTGHYAVKLAPEAQLTVDGKPQIIPPPPGLVHVQPGLHTLEAKAGPKTKSASSDAKAGETTNVDLSFDTTQPIAVVPVPATGPVTQPPTTTEPPHEPTYTESFWGWRSISGLALVVVGGVGIGVGVAAKSSESSDKDKIKDLQGQLPAGCQGVQSAACTSLSDAIQSRNDASSRATTFFILGGAAAGVGAGLVVSALVWPHRRQTSPSSGFLQHFTPVTGPRQAGLLFTSEF